MSGTSIYTESERVAHTEEDLNPDSRTIFIIGKLREYLMEHGCSPEIADNATATVEQITDYLLDLGDGAYWDMRR